ncbi:rCG41347 [Rattus norvegicus]|uniref:RCG41347 n=1 Tax=Rattus norvegicus TaxID=10116 RepID=A6IHM8_RAT|nr:rCG41347 [Rattus norvegicus]
MINWESVSSKET